MVGADIKLSEAYNNNRWKRSNNPAITQGGTEADEILKRLKRIAIVVFENLLASQFPEGFFCFLQGLIQ